MISCPGELSQVQTDNTFYLVACSEPFEAVNSSLLPELSVADALTISAGFAALLGFVWVYKQLFRAV